MAETENSVRNLVGFWFLGLCNNFAYVIMLSAAHDIVKEDSSNDTHSNETVGMDDNDQPGNSTYLQCNRISTAAILLADVLPGLCMKLLVPVYINVINYRVKVLLVMGFSAASFLIVGLTHSFTFSIIGVICASIGGGLGEPVFLGLSSFFHRNVISAWSSGTGAAGLFGALSYAGLTQVGVKPRTAVLMMLIVTALMGVSYFLVLKRPQSLQSPEVIDDDVQELLIDDNCDDVQVKFSPCQKLRLIPPLFKFMIPLCLVYFAEYFINQGLLEMLYFNNFWLSPQDQYRWYQVDYQLGVFLSRSSVNLFHIQQIWIMPVLQMANLVLLFCQIFLRFIPSFWIILVIVLYEGLLGGLAYVNTFFKMYNDVDSEKREYSMSVASISDTFGICIAGAIAIPIHNVICDLNIKM